MLYYMILLFLLLFSCVYGAYITYKDSLLHDELESYKKIYRFSVEDIRWAIRYMTSRESVRLKYHSTDQKNRIEELIPLLETEVHYITEMLTQKLLKAGKGIIDEHPFVKTLNDAQHRLNEIEAYSNTEDFITDLANRINEKQLK